MKTRNIIDAIIEIVSNNQYDVKAYAVANNRANAEGDALEDYIKDVFAGTLHCADIQQRNEYLSKHFSYLGNTNNPPDIMIRGGDAIEVKKIAKITSGLALNSSYPKAKLYSNSRMLNKACRECEEWTEKDMLYAVGVVNKGCLKSLMFVYGCDYCADKETYERIFNAVKRGVKSIKGVKFGETKELGRVNRIDPLGITYMRMRGMWHIESPFKVFAPYYTPEKTDFNFVAIINECKYQTFENRAELEQLEKENANLKIADVKIKNPNNPAELKNAKLITYAYTITD